MPTLATSNALRLDRWSARLAALLPTAPFYARSFAGDPIGTATVLLSWRDGLLDAGWDGAAIRGGGPRLASFAAIEALPEPAMLPGEPERLIAVERRLRAAPRRAYSTLTLVDDRAAWPERWRRVFALLEATGVIINPLDALAEPAPPDTDLGRLQSLIRSDRSPAAPDVRGDGSLQLLRAPTAHEGAAAVAALLRHGGREQSVVIRPGEPALLDDALVEQGLPALGARPTRRWRPAVQLLPLALELLFDPVDPDRVLELLTLPVAPFAMITRHMLAQAISDAPGIGGVRWQAVKARLEQRLGERAHRELGVIAAWLEADRHDATRGAPKEAVGAVVARVHGFLRGRQATVDDPVNAIALRQVAELAEILERDGRAQLDLVAVRQLADLVTITGATIEDRPEEAGRVDHVDHPGALLRPRDRVIWWQFVDATTRLPAYRPWRATERDALRRSGVVVQDPAALLDQEHRDLRRAVLGARRQLLLVSPRNLAGEPAAPHPFWDEIVARLHAGPREASRLTITVEDLLDRADRTVEALSSLPLPSARRAWRIAPGTLTPTTHHTPATLEHLLECPLRRVFEVAGIRSSALATVPTGPLLGGLLGQRLVQSLFELGAFEMPSDALRAHAHAILDALVAREASSLLQPGMQLERWQLGEQLVDAVLTLRRLMTRAGLTLVAVEHEVTASFAGGTVSGRLDLRLRDAAQRDAVLDLKWGRSAYHARLAEGRAVQLAVYAAGLRGESSAAPATGYFSLSRGELLTTEPDYFGETDGVDGPSTEETARRVAATVPLVEDLLRSGTIPVTGVRRSLPLLDALGIPAASRAGLFTCEVARGCDYCDFASLCGRAWEVLA